MKDIDSLKNAVQKTLSDNKAREIITIDLKNKSSIADYMVIASGTSSKHIQSLSEMVLKKFQNSGIVQSYIEGKESSDWKLIDGKDIIVHIFNPEKRKVYQLERMWSELIPEERIII